MLLAGVFDTMSRSQVGERVKRKGVLVNGKLVKKAGIVIMPGSEIEIEAWESAPTSVEANPALVCEVLYEDDQCVIINKAAGMLTHPTAEPTSFRESAASWLLAHGGHASDAIRPGIVHRLDRWTSGCLIMAKNDAALRFYAEAFEKRTVIKEYLALVEGVPAHPEGTIEAPIGRDTDKRSAMAAREDGRKATTSYRVLRSGSWSGDPVSLLLLRLHTGRTHQIRVHVAAIGHPVVGDPTYGAKLLPSSLSGQWLHAWRLTLPSMKQPGETISACASLPENFLQVLADAHIATEDLLC